MHSPLYLFLFLPNLTFPFIKLSPFFQIPCQKMEDQARVPAADYASVRGFDRRPGYLQTCPELGEVRISPPLQPVFQSLGLTKSPRTRRSLIEGELGAEGAVLSSKGYQEFAERARESEVRLEGLGIFEPGSVRLLLERGSSRG